MKNEVINYCRLLNTICGIIVNFIEYILNKFSVSINDEFKIGTK